jgi:capsular polysaccharide transport system permease protein
MTGALRDSLRVMWAIILRDLRTRFFNHGLGFLIAIAFPLVHILVLLGIYGALGRPAPYGDSTAVFFGTALAPFMTWNYMSRFVMYSLIMNRPLLAFPAVKILDIVFGRAALEMMAACCMVTVLVSIALIAGEDIMPHDVVEAAAAMGAALLLGLGFGLLSALISLALVSWTIIYTLIVISFYLLSGIVFLPHALPQELREPLSWIPTLHLVEWMRVAFFDGYPDDMLDRGYVLSWGAGSLLAGLALERAIRGRLLGG